MLHVYKLKEGWDVNNLFTIIPLNAAKSDILALQTIGRGLRLPFGEITGIEELDTLDIVAHDHYREIVDDIKNNPVFKKRNLDEEDIPNTKTVMVEPAVENQQISLFDKALCESKVKSYQDLNNENVVENLFIEYQKAFVKKQYQRSPKAIVDRCLFLIILLRMMEMKQVMARHQTTK